MVSFVKVSQAVSLVLAAAAALLVRATHASLATPARHTLLPWLRPPAATPANAVAADLKAMLSEGYNSDITLFVKSKRFAAHRAILGARSPYFKGLFAGRSIDRSARAWSIEADSDDLAIKDMEPDVFEQLLIWLYTGEVAEGALEAKGMLEHLLVAANRYECGGLKLLCEAKLCEGLAVENVAKRLVASEQAEADELKEACLDFIKPNAAAVIGTEGWKDVMAAGVELMNEVMALLVGAPAGGGGKKRTADEAGLSAQDQEVEAMREWKVVRLRDALQGHALSIEGRKPELVERLERAIRRKGNEAGSEPSGNRPATGGAWPK